MLYLSYVENIDQLEVIRKFNIDEIIITSDNLIKKDIDLKKWFLLDILPFNKDIEDIKIKLKLLEKNNFYGVIIQDVSILNIINEEDIKLKLILDLATGGNNIEFYKFFSSFDKVESIFLSRELRKDKILKYLDYGFNLSLQAYGMLKIFNTKRKLISNLRNTKNLDIKNTIFLKEPKRRDELFTLTENEYGTIMYNSKIISAHYFMDDLKNYRNLRFVLDLRHIKDIDKYSAIFDFFINKKMKVDINKLEKLPLVKLGRDLEKDSTGQKDRYVGVILDVKKNSYTLFKLRDNFEIKEDTSLFLINDKKKKIVLNLNNIKEIAKDIYLIPYQRGVVSNSQLRLEI